MLTNGLCKVIVLSCSTNRMTTVPPILIIIVEVGEEFKFIVFWTVLYLYFHLFYLGLMARNLSHCSVVILYLTYSVRLEQQDRKS